MSHGEISRIKKKYEDLVTCGFAVCRDHYYSFSATSCEARAFCLLLDPILA